MPRTKQPDRDRYSNGRAKPAEGPTVETLKKHLQRASILHIPTHMDPGYAESTFGVLFSRGMISVEQYELCKTLANLRSVLFGSGNPKCSSIENASRGLPNDTETKKMRETWAAYKAATESLVKDDRVLFEMVILRNVYREWMRLPDGELFRLSRCKDHDPDRMLAALRSPSAADGSLPIDPVNYFRTSEGSTYVFGLRRELRQVLRVIQLVHERMPGAKRQARTDKTAYTALSQAQRDALDGGDVLLDKLYAKKEQGT